MDKIILGGGCFWCTEAIFQRLKGVISVKSGYAGGEIPNPSYDEVCEGNTGHVEAIEIEFNPQEIELGTILEVFLHTHNPTIRNQQGNDIGTQYQSTVFYFDEKQKEIVKKVIDKITKEGIYSKPIITDVKPYINFYEAEKYHQNYYNRNESAPYCSFIIAPKIQKLLKEYSHLTK